MTAHSLLPLFLRSPASPSPWAGAGPAALEDFEVARYGEPLFFPNSGEWRKRHGGGS